MKTIKRFCVLALFLMASTAWAGQSSPAPDFALKSLSGNNVRLSELRGQVVLVNFWASWCGPCRQEMPLLDQLHNQYKPLGFTVLGVNVEQNSDAARHYLKDLAVHFPVLLDSTNTASKAYDVQVMPTTVIVDRNGDVRYVHKGYAAGDEAKYQDVVRKLISE